MVNSLSCQKTTVNGTAYTSEASTYLDTTRNYYNNKKIFRMVTVPYFSMRSYMPGVGTPYNGLYGEALPERGTFFRLQVYKRVGISQV